MVSKCARITEASVAVLGSRPVDAVCDEDVQAGGDVPNLKCYFISSNRLSWQSVLSNFHADSELFTLFMWLCSGSQRCSLNGKALIPDDFLSSPSLRMLAGLLSTPVDTDADPRTISTS